MPYITPERRVTLQPILDQLEKLDGMTPGDLNYLFTQISRWYLNRKGKRYTFINDVVGALACCKLELYRRVASPYEDEKIAENGDVYGDI